MITGTTKRFLCVLVTIVVSELTGSAGQGIGQAAKEDVTSPEAIVAAFLASGSGPAGPRDFNRMKTLFAPNARVITIRRSKTEPAIAVTRSIDQYAEEAGKYLATNANYESVVKSWVERYANLAQVFCSFEARHTPEGEVFYRGVGSFQLLWDGGRWWILTAYWQGEREGEPLPAKYRQ
jgi:hypothetical protein